MDKRSNDHALHCPVTMGIGFDEIHKNQSNMAQIAILG